MTDWNVVIYFIAIGVLLFVGKFLKTTFPFLSKIVLPTALLGGFVGLIIAQLLYYFVIKKMNPDAPYFVDVDLLTTIVYHALALGFISLTLRQGENNKNKRKVWSTGMVITSTYALQAVIGIAMVMIFFSDKFVGAGMLLPLGFGQGPGLATSFGRMWADMLGGATTGIALGVSYAVIGFLFGGIVGVIAINVLSRRKGEKKPGHYSDSSLTTTTIEIDTVKEVSVLDGLTVQVVIISIIYGLVWLTLFIMQKILVNFGSIGGTIFGLLSGFNFIIGIMYSLIYKAILKRYQAKGKNVRFMKNDYILSNISSLCFNVMITGAVLTITTEFLSEFGVLLGSICAVGGIATLFYVRFVTKRVYPEYKDEYFVGLFGMLTGIAATGIALLKGLDRNLESPVAEEMVLGSGTAITIALPLFGFLMLPSLGYGQTYETLFTWITLLGCLLYVAVIFSILMVRSRKNIR
jgi:ESS family glutamate:Na+ symporter